MEQQQFMKQEWTKFIWVTVGGIAALILVLLWEYLPCIQFLKGPCFFHEVLHVYCPGCGGTRAVYELLQLKLWRSFVDHPLVIFTAAILVEYYIGEIITLICRNGKRYYYVRVWFCYVALGIIVVNVVLKNVLLIGFHIDLIGDLLKYWI